MRTIKYILSFIFFLLIASCENVDVVEHDLPFEELTVINGQISPGDVNPAITFTKTLPLNITYDIERAEIKDIIAYLKSEDETIYPLEYHYDGIYRPKNNFLAQPGATYELFADNDGNKMYGITKVPAVPVLTNTQIIDGHISCELVPAVNEVYSCVYVLIENSQYGNPSIAQRENEFFSVEGPFEEGSGAITIRTGVVPREYRNENAEFKLGVEIYAWDKSYKKYFETKDNNKPIDDIFSQGGGSIDWNVSGENAIGLFIGFSTLVYSDIIK